MLSPSTEITLNEGESYEARFQRWSILRCGCIIVGFFASLRRSTGRLCLRKRHQLLRERHTVSLRRGQHLLARPVDEGHGTVRSRKRNVQLCVLGREGRANLGIQ